MDEQQRISVVSSSSNSSSMVSSKTYDVFLSFRGEDTRRNFTSHLYKALNEKKVKTYIDDKLEKGDEISPALIKAIEDSHVSIVIFSENYASSKWCLGELSKILECQKEKGLIVIPVFYNIDPSHVRKQTGSYEQAFAKHEGEHSCIKWKAALTKAANLAGWDSRTYRTDPELLEDIVKGVLQKLPPRFPNQPRGMVGIQENVKHIESLLSEVKILGIWGMGGIGKTTLATALYDKMSHKFEGRCFLTNVREKSDNLQDLCDNSEISRLRGKKVFIVLDDVATSEQLEKLIEDYDFWEPGSKVIVTTRNKQIFRPHDKIYPVQELSFDHSLQLFCLTAFGEKEQPKNGYEDLSRRVISYCQGIPLALKVLGASLRRRSKEAWECQLRKLQEIPKMQLHNVLKFSYDGLDDYEKNIFLDIACFFKGEEKDWVTNLLKAFDFYPDDGIEVLLDKALIKISYSGVIEMHDLIQEMGRQIVHQKSKDPGRRSRLWRSNDVLDVLKNNKGTDVVEGIILDLYTLTKDLYLSSSSLAKMTKLRFLQIHRGYTSANKFEVYLPSGLESLSDELRYLHWDSFCLESLPPNFCAEKLVMLHMSHSKLKKLWDGVQNLVNLKTVNLYGSRDLIEIPDLSMAVKLESVCLRDCESLCQFHPSKLSFPKLIVVDLRGCREIESVNIHSKSLTELYVFGCLSLREFSVTSEELTELDLSHTAIRSLPSSMLSLPKLTYLNLSHWKEIESLHVHSKSLRVLELTGCSSLKKFSVTSEEITKLYLSCTAISALPSPLLKLTDLDLRGCTNIEILNVHLKYLHVLRLNGCSSLKEISLASEEMTELDLSHIGALMSSMLFLPKLTSLCLNGCKRIQRVDVHSKSLRKLHISSCSSLKEITWTSEEITDLELSHIDIPALMSSMLSLPKLTNLCLNGFKRMERVDVQSKYLRVLRLNGCSSLKEISLASEEMTKLDLSDCREIESLIVHSKCLCVLELIGCSSLKEFSVTSEEMTKLDLSHSAIRAFVSSMLSLPRLTFLNLSQCKEIESLHVDSKSLRVLELTGCSSLKELSVISEEMTKLYLSGTAISALPSSLLKLTDLDLSGCTNIEILNLHLESLRVLRLNGCSSLKEISLTSEEITELDLSHTDILALMSSMLSLPKLTNLCLKGCKRIQRVDVHSKSLCKLNLYGCSSLKEISVTSEEITELDLFDCREVESLIVHSKSLCVLNLGGLSSLREITVTSEKMRDLYLSHTAICALPSSIGDLLSIEVLDLSKTNVEILPANIKNLSMLRELWLNDCKKLMSLSELPPSLEELGLENCWELTSLPELPPSLEKLWLNDCRKLVCLSKLPLTMSVVSALNCIALGIEITQWLVLQHMLQSRIPYLHQQYLNNPEYSDDGYFMFPGDYVTNSECGFHTTERSISIPYLPKSLLCGFIYYCIILSKDVWDDDGSDDDVWECWDENVSVYICQDDIEVYGGTIGIIYKGSLISKHVLFSYVDVSQFDRISEVYDHFNNLTFKFEMRFLKGNIKGCGVFPVYATASGLKLVSSSKEIGIGGSDNENEQDPEQPLPATKKKRTSQ